MVWIIPARPQDYFPRKAQLNNVQGKASVLCDIGEDHRLNCSVESEGPAGSGLGAAAVALFDHTRVKPKSKNGQPTAGRRVRGKMNFTLR